MKKYLDKEFLLSNKEKIIKVAIVTVLVIAAFFVFVLGAGGKDEEQMMITTEETSAAEESSEPEIIMVDVGGAVCDPKVVELPRDSRVCDAISMAGGLKDDADTSQINQAAFLTDGEKIYIPEKGEASSASTAGGTSVSAQAGKIDINTASSEELQSLNGVGPATAEKILKYRADAGYFKSIEEIKNVDGIGDKTFEKLKDYITV